MKPGNFRISMELSNAEHCSLFERYQDKRYAAKEDVVTDLLRQNLEHEADAKAWSKVSRELAEENKALEYELAKVKPLADEACGLKTKCETQADTLFNYRSLMSELDEAVSQGYEFGTAELKAAMIRVGSLEKVNSGFFLKTTKKPSAKRIRVQRKK